MQPDRQSSSQHKVSSTSIPALASSTLWYVVSQHPLAIMRDAGEKRQYRTMGEIDLGKDVAEAPYHAFTAP